MCIQLLEYDQLWPNMGWCEIWIEFFENMKLKAFYFRWRGKYFFFTDKQNNKLKP